MNKIDDDLLNTIVKNDIDRADAYNIRKNGQGIKRKVSPYIDIVSKEDGTGIDIIVKENTKFGIVDIPVIITENGLKDVVYNDFYIGRNSNVVIMAGCGIHNDLHDSSEHDGIHRFFIEENAKVKYIENHYASGDGEGRKILNPTTEINMKKGSEMIMNTTQIKGVDKSIRVTKAIVETGATLVVNEKILTNNKQVAKTSFDVKLVGKNASSHVVSRSVAADNSYQEFNSSIVGKTECYGHVECDAIIKDNGEVKAIPKIHAKNVDARLIHEATIGKIAGSQLMKLMSLGLSFKEAEDVIIKGFLK